jgi:hypothetical protein
MAIPVLRRLRQGSQNGHANDARGGSLAIQARSSTRTHQLKRPGPTTLANPNVEPKLRFEATDTRQFAVVGNLRHCLALSQFSRPGTNLIGSGAIPAHAPRL